MDRHGSLHGCEEESYPLLISFVAASLLAKLIIRVETGGLLQGREMSTLLQPGQEHDAGERRRRADHEEHGPAGLFGNEPCPRREVGASDCGEGGEQRILGGGMKRAPAKRRQV